jgi:copper resistance protein B
MRVLAFACALAMTVHASLLAAQDGHPPAQHSTATAAQARPTRAGTQEHADHNQRSEHRGHAGHDAPPRSSAAERRADQEPETPKEPIPPLSDADRTAAFPELAAHSEHAEHGERVVSMLLVDRLEVWSEDGERGQHWELQAWAGGDLQRVWLRSSGEREDGTTHAADLELLYGRSLTPWWDLLAGVRHDTAPGPAQTWAAVGVHGMAPYKFEVEATAYLGRDGRSTARFEAEYDLLLTNRLILQPSIELELHDRRDLRRDTGAGLSKVEAGLRMRYEITRRFAPYVGLVHERTEAADGQHEREQRWVGGLRLWF